MEVRHKLEALLLLVSADHVKPLAQLLELPLQTEREGQPAHVGRAPTLPEVYNPGGRFGIRVFGLAWIRGVGFVFRLWRKKGNMSIAGVPSLIV